MIPSNRWTPCGDDPLLDVPSKLHTKDAPYCLTSDQHRFVSVMIEIFDIDYSEHVDIIGTAHFTRRSISEAYEAVQTLNPQDVAIELDWRRFRLLSDTCLFCPRKDRCKGICEFTGAADAIGNVDANIWLIDMTEPEIRGRIRSRMTPFERANLGFRIPSAVLEDPVRLWERGFKGRVIENSKRRIDASRRVFPSVWRVLIDERDALMAARLAWITSQNLNEETPSKILALVGAAHVEGIERLLRNPLQIKTRLSSFNLRFTEPKLIRRVAVQGD